MLTILLGCDKFRDSRARYQRRLEDIGVATGRGVPTVELFADAEADPLTGVRDGGGRDAFKRCSVFIGNFVLERGLFQTFNTA